MSRSPGRGALTTYPSKLRPNFFSVFALGMHMHPVQPPGYPHVAHIQQILTVVNCIMFAINNCSTVRHCYASTANERH